MVKIQSTSPVAPITLAQTSDSPRYSCLTNATAPRLGEGIESVASRVIGAPQTDPEKPESSHRSKFTPLSKSRITRAKECVIRALNYLIFKVKIIFKSLLFIIMGTVMILAGIPIMFIPPTASLGKELFWNGIFSLKLAKGVAFEGLGNNTLFDSSNLLTGEEGGYQSEFSWYLNLGLMRSAHERTADPALKKQIRFLAANYLAKAAPGHARDFRILDPRFDEVTQIAPFVGSAYHRWSCLDEVNKKVFAKINNQLAIGDKSPIILTDTDELNAPLKLGYTIFTPEEFWVDKMQEALEAHLAQNPNKPFEKPINMLFDMTDLFKDIMSDKTKKNEAYTKLNELRKRAETVIAQVVARHPQLDKKKLFRFLLNNMTCITRLKFDGFAAIKLLPLRPGKYGENLLKKHQRFLEFLCATGLYINRVTLYRHLFESQVFEKDTAYAVQGPRDTQYFKKIADLTRTYVPFERDEERPYTQIIGNGTLNLLKGWVSEIGQTRWEQLTQDPVLREILDASLYKIKIQFATAQLEKNNYNKFMQAMELIHAELATLLELTTPFTQAEFSDIYRDQLTIVPESVKAHVKGGVGKTAMNVYAAINTAVSKMVARPVKAHCPQLYFEEALFLGQSSTVEKAVADQSNTWIDLYSTQFNSNIQIDSTHTNYQATDVAGDIRKLLAAKPDTQHLTVSVDCTIDYFNSPKVRDLLATFEEEIKDGRLNFVFLRSGQKFEMLGMDNYYGSPYYIVNNGEPKWDAFKHLNEDPAYQPDNLSTQWFCLVNRYASDAIEAYRHQIFQNSRDILNQVPSGLKPRGNPKDQRIRVNTVDSSMDPTFIDIKLTGLLHRIRGHLLIGEFHRECVKRGVLSDSRASFGFYHPNVINISVNAADESSSIRITPGLDKQENKIIAKFFQHLINRI